MTQDRVGCVRLVLVFDADDTLWENNVRFDRVVADFLAWLARPTLDEGTVRAVLRDVEAATLEHEDLDPEDDAVLRLPAFADLLQHF